jgi:hypothetical protein
MLRPAGAREHGAMRRDEQSGRLFIRVVWTDMNSKQTSWTGPAVLSFI